MSGRCGAAGDSSLSAEPEKDCRFRQSFFYFVLQGFVGVGCWVSFSYVGIKGIEVPREICTAVYVYVRMYTIECNTWYYIFVIPQKI